MTRRSAIIPCLVYRDAPTAIAFLEAAFGFARNLVYASADGRRIDHAQLTLDGNMVMVSSADLQRGLDLATPAETGGKVTAAIYVVLDDPDVHHARAAKAGAEIINPPSDQIYGGRGYEARDSEGNVWSFGTYDPFEVFQGG